MSRLLQYWRRLESTRIGRSIFRVGFPRDIIERSRVMISSFFLHIHPARVRRRSLEPQATFGLGVISLVLFLVLTASGVLLMFYYIPSTERAYADMKDLEFVVTAGQLIRNIHRWAAHLMVGAVFLHMCRVFYMAAYKPPREFNWVIGVLLLLMTLFLSFTGYLLPWDQLAFWAVTVGANIAGYAPVVGERLRFILLGGTTVGQSALTRFYALHVMVLPIAVGVLVSVHLWRVRKDGGLAHDCELPEIATREYERADLPASKSYGLMELARGSSSAVNADPDDTVASWPHLLIRELVVALVVSCLILALAVLFDAPLEEPANAGRPPNPAKAPWYFLGLQELVSYSALWGGIIVPGLIVAVLIALPYVDRNPAGSGRWFARERRLGISVFTVFVVVFLVLTIIGTFFRGPNWAWQIPWAVISPSGH